MASNTQIVIEVIALIIVMVVLYKQAKALFLKDINGFTITKDRNLYTVKKDNKAIAQFVYKRSAQEYCRTH